MAVIDLTGMEFGSWTVLGRAPRHPTVRQAAWLCRCKCGFEAPVISDNLRRGISTGCVQCRAVVHIKHGKSRTPEAAAHKAILHRCFNPKAKSYQDYGGRGITVCERWQGERGLENFISDMGPRPGPGYSIDRRDNNGHYCKENCRWATRKQQQNNRRNTTMLTAFGETLPLAEWAARLGIDPHLIHNRLRRGWAVDVAVSTPLHPTIGRVKR